MSIDYKRLQAPGPDSSGTFLIGLFFGFLLGLGVAAGIAIYFFKTPVPFSDRTRLAEKAPVANPSLQEPAKPAAAEASKTEVKPRFDFYRILPGREEPVTERQIREAARQPGKAGTSRDSYFIQTGSFPNPADADNLKAKIAMLGLEASVEPADIAGKGVWYRVRLGPYARIDEINRVRQQLTQNGVDASLVRVKDVAPN